MHYSDQLNRIQFDIDLIWEFWRQVDMSYNKTGCWLWLGKTWSRGYGYFTINNVQYSAHRVSYVLQKGKIINDLHVLHVCDNPPCVYPGHLFLGTQRDNSVDMARKARGSKQISHELVRLIKELSDRGVKKAEISRLLKIDVRTVFRALTSRRQEYAKNA